MNLKYINLFKQNIIYYNKFEVKYVWIINYNIRDVNNLIRMTKIEGE